MSLTTPQAQEDFSILPGENWFLYWKTSISLWQQKLSLIKGHRVFVPLNWSFHSETGDVYDFGELRPETNLKKLLETVKSLKKEISFLLPLGPAPFIQNGGIPSLLARIPSVMENQMSLSVVNNEGQIHKIYSYYDPRVFKGFLEWVKALGNFMTKQGMQVSIYGCVPGFLHGLNFHSYLQDFSVAYESSFDRFLRTQKLENEAGLDWNQEQQKRKEFVSSIESLYVETAKQELKNYFDGPIPLVFLGGNPIRVPMQGVNQNVEYTYEEEIRHSMELGFLTSSTLVDDSKKRTVLGRYLNDCSNYLIWESQLFPPHHEDIAGGPFKFLRLVYFYVKQKSLSSQNHYLRLGLINFLNKKIPQCWKIADSVNFTFEESTDLSPIHFFSLADLNTSGVSQVIKLFMAGAKIIIDKSGVGREALQRLELFIIENNLKVEKIQFYGPVQNISLGDGRIVLLDLTETNLQNEKEIDEFWTKIVLSFTLSIIGSGDNLDIPFSWWNRVPADLELRFEEIRRLSLYNPSSYKKKMKFTLPRNFAFIKIVDEYRTDVQSHPSEIEVQILPEGHVHLDFGKFS